MNAIRSALFNLLFFATTAFSEATSATMVSDHDLNVSMCLATARRYPPAGGLPSRVRRGYAPPS